MITSKITVKHFYQLKYHRECNCSHLYATYWLISGNRNILYLLSHIVNGSVVKGHVRLNSLVIHICTGNASQTLLTRHLFSSSGKGHCPTYVKNEISVNIMVISSGKSAVTAMMLLKPSNYKYIMD